MYVCFVWLLCVIAMCDWRLNEGGMWRWCVHLIPRRSVSRRWSIGPLWLFAFLLREWFATPRVLCHEGRAGHLQQTNFHINHKPKEAHLSPCLLHVSRATKLHLDAVFKVSIKNGFSSNYNWHLLPVTRRFSMFSMTTRPRSVSPA